MNFKTFFTTVGVPAGCFIEHKKQVLDSKTLSKIDKHFNKHLKDLLSASDRLTDHYIRNAMLLAKIDGSLIGENRLAACWARHSWRGDSGPKGPAFLVWPAYQFNSWFDSWNNKYMTYLYQLPLVKSVMQGTWEDVQKRGYHIFDMTVPSDTLRYVMILVRGLVEDADHSGGQLRSDIQELLEQFELRSNSHPLKLYDLLVQSSVYSPNTNHRVSYISDRTAAQFCCFVLFGFRDTTDSAYNKGNYPHGQCINTLARVMSDYKVPHTEPVDREGIALNLYKSPTYVGAFLSGVKRIKDYINKQEIK